MSLTLLIRQKTKYQQLWWPIYKEEVHFIGSEWKTSQEDTVGKKSKEEGRREWSLLLC
jgi:hypothetical protein